MESPIAVLGTMPQASLFTFPPNHHPATLPPPPPGVSASAPPFAIPDHIFAAALDPKVPLTIALLYAVTVKALNRYNISNGKKPWGISQTRPFSAFVVLHNVFLAVYSAWTFWGMLGAMMRSVVSPRGPNGLVGTVDSICKLSGGAGLGEAVFYNPSLGQWKSLSNQAQITSEGLPSNTAMGRIWNEGLAFYGWIFYLSKFYEVLDTFIILAKGKLSSTLQTYHHAGAMMCMWAGMRYMSAPIWMFVFVNSGIHAMMVCLVFSFPPCNTRTSLTTTKVHILHSHRILDPGADAHQAGLDLAPDHAVSHWGLLRYDPLLHLLHSTNNSHRPRLSTQL
jgi:hypothetical protein